MLKVVLATHRLQVRETEDETDSIKDIRLSGAIKTSNCVERRVPARDDGPYWVRLEAVEDELFDVHRGS